MSPAISPRGMPNDNDEQQSQPELYAHDATDEPSDKDLEEIVLAINYSERRSIGCAYYVARTQTLFFMEDFKAGDTSIVESLRLYVQPTTILLPANCPAEVVSLLTPEDTHPAREGSWTPDSLRLPYLLQTRPSAEFGYESAKHKLANLKLEQDDGPEVVFTVPGDFATSDQVHLSGAARSADRQGQLLRLSGWINIDSRLTVGCAGAVLAFIQRQRSTSYLPGDSSAASLLAISKLQMFTLAGSMLVNADALHSLQILSTENHPGAQTQGSASKSWSSQGAKEGLSVYGLFAHQAKTTQGKALLRQYFLRPSMNLEVINERLDTISLLLRPKNTEQLERICKHLAKIKNMYAVMQRMRKGISLEAVGSRNFSSSTFARLRHFSYHALCITDVLEEIEGSHQLVIVDKYRRVLDTQKLAEIGRLISDMIDLEASEEQHRTVVQRGVDAALDAAKRTYEGLEELLSQAAEHFADRIPSELNSEISVIFFPQIGFLVSVRLDPRTGTGVYEGVGEEQWERVFTTESNAYYKNTIVAELDREFGDVYGKMCDREIELAQKLAEYILESETLIQAVSDVCGELDCLTALACGARHFNLTRPEVVRENNIDIVGGRHILQELTVPAFVANDTSLHGGSAVEGSPTMIILTGPNYSGKSIYLKQVALITYMAHVGSFVPAESARIGLTNKILTRTSTRETVSRESSAFMIDLQQIALSLNLGTPRSLLIIDEFGKGTDSADGAGLAAGVLEHLLARGTDAPRVLAATHYHEIFESGFLQPQPGLAFAHMEVRVDETAAQVEQQITYLYTYREGRSLQSFGTCCAAMNGVPEAIVTRAEQLVLLAARGFSLTEACAELPTAELAELGHAERIARDILACDHMDEPRAFVEQMLAVEMTERGSTSTYAMATA